MIDNLFCFFYKMSKTVKVIVIIILSPVTSSNILLYPNNTHTYSVYTDRKALTRLFWGIFAFKNDFNISSCR